MRYSVIVADPPWGFSDTLKSMKSGTKRSAQSQYQTMPVIEISQLPIRNIADNTGSVLALWVPGSFLEAGFNVMNSWGFNFKQIFVWGKTKKNTARIEDLNDAFSFGMGRLFRQSHEVALIGTIGKIYAKLKNKSQRSIALDTNEGHSVKTEMLQDRLELMFPDTKKIELFARRARVGWTCLGNEIDGRDIREALNELNSDLRVDTTNKGEKTNEVQDG
jgi:N6-adenosine-specific RNA methylase IME4